MWRVGGMVLLQAQATSLEGSTRDGTLFLFHTPLGTVLGGAGKGAKMLEYTCYIVPMLGWGAYDMRMICASRVAYGTMFGSHKHTWEVVEV